MLEKFKQWHLRNQVKINWFIIGWLSLGLIHALARRDYVDAAICVAIITINVIFNRNT